MIHDHPSLTERAIDLGAQSVIDAMARVISVPGNICEAERIIRMCGMFDTQFRNAYAALANLGHVESTRLSNGRVTLHITPSGWEFASVPRPIWMEGRA